MACACICWENVSKHLREEFSNVDQTESNHDKNTSHRASKPREHLAHGRRKNEQKSSEQCCSRNKAAKWPFIKK